MKINRVGLKPDLKNQKYKWALAKTYMKQKNKNIVQITSGKGPVECEFFVQETFNLMKKRNGNAKIGLQSGRNDRR